MLIKLSPCRVRITQFSSLHASKCASGSCFLVVLWMRGIGSMLCYLHISSTVLMYREWLINLCWVESQIGKSTVVTSVASTFVLHVQQMHMPAGSHSILKDFHCHTFHCISNTDEQSVCIWEVWGVKEMKKAVCMPGLLLPNSFFLSLGGFLFKES